MIIDTPGGGRVSGRLRRRSSREWKYCRSLHVWTADAATTRSRGYSRYVCRTRKTDTQKNSSITLTLPAYLAPRPNRTIFTVSTRIRRSSQTDMCLM